MPIIRDLYTLSHRQQAVVAKAIGSWNFSAHDFSEDELVHASFLMLQHALNMPELKPWRIPAGELVTEMDLQSRSMQEPDN